MPGIIKKTENEKKSNAVGGMAETNLSALTTDALAVPQLIRLTALQRLSILAAIIAFQDRIDEEEEESESDSDTDDSDSDWDDFDYFYSSAPFRPYSTDTPTASFGQQVIDEMQEQLFFERRLRRPNKKSKNCVKKRN